MAYNKNTMFYHEYNGIYRLTFIPGSVTALSTPSTEYFPPDIIIESDSDLKIAKNYGDDVPLHLEETPEITIKINLSRMTGDYADVKNWILNNADITDATIYGSVSLSYGFQSFIHPNQWIIEKDTNGDGNYDTVIFNGMQLVNPSYEIEQNENHENVCKLIVLDSIRTVAQAYTRDMIISTVDNLGSLYQETEVYDIFNIDVFVLDGTTYNVLYFAAGSIIFNELRAAVTFNTLSQKTIAIRNDYVAIYEAFARKSITTPTFELFGEEGVSGDPITNYESNCLLSNERDGALTSILTYDSDAAGQGGLFSNGNGALDFENLWDLLYSMYMSVPCKSQISTDGDILMSRVFSTTADTPRSLDTKYITKYVYKNGYNIVSKSITSAQEWQVNESIGGSNEYKAAVDGVFNQDSKETEVQLYSEPVTQYPWYKPNGGTVAVSWSKTAYVNPRNLYYFTSKVFAGITFDIVRRVSMFPKVNLGDGVVIDNVNTTGITIDEYRPNYDIYYKKIIEQDAIGHLGSIAEAYNYILGNANQGLLECNVSNDQILPEYLGDEFTIDINTLLGVTSPVYSQKCYLVSIEYDTQSNTSACKFFVRGK